MKLHEPLPIRLLTHNIRYATNSPFKGEEKWGVRKSRLINELSFNTAHCAESFICLQEVLHLQLVDVLSGLNSKEKAWAYVGVGRDDGLEAGEYSPICMYLQSPAFLFRIRSWFLKYTLGIMLLLPVLRVEYSPQIGNTDNQIMTKSTNLEYG